MMTGISKMIDQHRIQRPFVMNLITFDESKIGNDLSTNVNATYGAVPVSTTMPPIITDRNMSSIEYKRTR